MQVVKEILVADPDRGICRLARGLLQGQGYHVATVHQSAEVLKYLQNHSPHLLLMATTLLTSEGGHTLAKWLATHRASATILMGADWDVHARQVAAEWHSFRFLLKPFQPDALLGLVQICGGTGLDEPLNAGRLRLGNMELDVVGRRILIGEREVRLTPTEAVLLSTLLHHRGQIISHDELLGAAWGPQGMGKRQYLHIYIRRLRQKLEGFEGGALVTALAEGYSLCLYDSTV